MAPPALDRVRFERLIADLAPELTIHAMADTNPEDAAPRIDQNLWGRTVTMSAPADQWELAPSDAFTRTSEPHSCAAQPAIVEIAIERGVPVAVNGVPLDIDELVEVVDTIAGDHGVGRFDQASRSARALVEAPAAAVLSAAIAELASASFDRDMLALARPDGAGLRGADRRGPVAYARARRPRRVHRGLVGPIVWRRPPAAVARRVPRRWPPRRRRRHRADRRRRLTKIS